MNRASCRPGPLTRFFLIDDLGWADVGCNGSTFYETPNVDRLATDGMHLNAAGYAAWAEALAPILETEGLYPVLPTGAT